MKLLQAIKDTFPIFVSYFALSISFGILGVKMGIDPYLLISMSIFIYSGSLQFLLLGIYNKLSLIDIFITSFLLNFRQFFYSLTFLDRYKNHFYKIFTLTDETFAILSHKKYGPDYDLYVSILNHLYWISGTICGVVFANYFDFELKGLDFILVSLFVVILVEKLISRKKLFPLFLGICSYFFFYIIQIPNILIFSILTSLLVIIIKEKYA
ncbi:azaleucine resistance protein AzlC [Desulfothermus okinawensis JCM 13304]